MTIYQYDQLIPHIEDSAYVAPEAVVIGDVTLGPECSVWPCAVLRGDNEPISLGEGSNAQDGAILHTAAWLHHREWRPHRHTGCGAQWRSHR